MPYPNLKYCFFSTTISLWPCRMITVAVLSLDSLVDSTLNLSEFYEKETITSITTFLSIFNFNRQNYLLAGSDSLPIMSKTTTSTIDFTYRTDCTDKLYRSGSHLRFRFSSLYLRPRAFSSSIVFWRRSKIVL